MQRRTYFLHGPILDAIDERASSTGEGKGEALRRLALAGLVQAQRQGWGSLPADQSQPSPRRDESDEAAQSSSESKTSDPQRGKVGESGSSSRRRAAPSRGAEDRTVDSEEGTGGTQDHNKEGGEGGTESKNGLFNSILTD